MLQNSKLFRLCVYTLILLLIIYMIAKVRFLFHPLITMFNILIVPFILAGFVYYLLRPIVHALIAQKMNKIAAILLIYVLFAALLFIFFMVVWPPLIQQLNNFVNSAPVLIEEFKIQMANIQNNRAVGFLTKDDLDISSKLSDMLNKSITFASNYVSNVVSAVTSFFIVVATAPIISYYLLKEGDTIRSTVLFFIPSRYTRDAKEVMDEIDSALSGFILGRMIITFFLGIMMYIGFLIIGLPYSLLIAIIATVLNIIPYIGPILGAIPCIIVAFIHSPTMVLWVLIVVLLAQQIENLLSPFIYGKRIDIHPLTTIILLLVAGELSGILGIILAIPVYMVMKIIIVRIYRLFLAEKVEELVE